MITVYREVTGSTLDRIVDAFGTVRGACGRDADPVLLKQQLHENGFWLSKRKPELVGGDA
jgi:hypothetical protein